MEVLPLYVTLASFSRHIISHCSCHSYTWTFNVVNDCQLEVLETQVTKDPQFRRGLRAFPWQIGIIWYYNWQIIRLVVFTLSSGDRRNHLKKRQLYECCTFFLFHLVVYTVLVWTSVSELTRSVNPLTKKC